MNIDWVVASHGCFTALVEKKVDRMIEKLQSCARSIQSFIPLDLFSTKKGSAAGMKIRTDLVQRMDVWVKESKVLKVYV